MRQQLLFVGLLLMTTVASASGQSLFEPKRDPYRNLFRPPARLQNVRPTPPRPALAQPLKPKVVCGMVVIPADPNVDPKIFARVPATRQTFTMRTVRPPVCKPE